MRKSYNYQQKPVEAESQKETIFRQIQTRSR